MAFYPVKVVCGLGFGVQGSGFQVQGLSFRVKGLGLKRFRACRRLADSETRSLLSRHMHEERGPLSRQDTSRRVAGSRVQV